MQPNFSFDLSNNSLGVVNFGLISIMTQVGIRLTQVYTTDASSGGRLVLSGSYPKCWVSLIHCFSRKFSFLENIAKPNKHVQIIAQHQPTGLYYILWLVE